MNGFLLIDKPTGMTSHDVVYHVKKALKIKKVGHTGTLDPFASGLLILCVGKATKLASLFSNLGKSYEGVIKFFKHYDTYDVTGTVEKEKVIHLDMNQLQITAKSFEKAYDQEPPMYSAIKIDGKKLYELARSGKTIDRPKRPVEIKKFEVFDFKNDEISFKTDVSKGTYIRSLAVDYAQSLGTYAALKTLRRTKVGRYHVLDAIKLDEASFEHLISFETFFKDYNRLTLSDYLIHLVKNGIYLDERQIVTNKPFVVVDKHDKMIAYYEVIEENKYKPILIF